MRFGQVDTEAPEAARAFATRLRSVAHEAGYTSLRELATDIDVGHNAVWEALTARRVPTWDTLAELLRTCGVIPDQDWAEAREAAREAVDRQKRAVRAAGLPGEPERESGSEETRATPPGPGTFSIRAPYGELPPRVRGREALLEQLEAGLVEGAGRLHVLHGLGGCGKTTVALHLARQARDRGVRVFWLSATSPDRLVTGMREVAGELGVGEEAITAAWAGRASATDLVWGALDGAERPWLLVMDNVDEPHRLASDGGVAADAAGWIRSSRAGMTVVTSRVGSPDVWGHEAETHRVDVLSPADGRDVLLDLAGEAGDPDDALLLAERLGGLPLALRLAGSYLARSARGAGLLRPRGRSTERVRSFATYTKAIDEAGARFLDLGERRQLTEADAEDLHRRLISRTWELSLDLLEDQQLSEARSLMRLLSCCAPAPFPVDLLDADVLAEIGVDLRLDPERADRALEALTDLSLVDVVDIAPNSGATGQESILCLVSHRLVLEANASSLAGDPESNRVGVWRALARILERGAEPAPEQPRNWRRWRLLAPHIRLALANAPDDHEILLPLLRAGLATFAFYNFSGSDHSAEELVRSLAQRCTWLPVNDPTRLSIRHRAALSLLKGEEELQEYESIAAEQTAQLGIDHPETLITRHNLVLTGHRLGRISGADAEAEVRAILRARRRVLGPDDQYTLLTHGALAEIVDARLRGHDVVGDDYTATIEPIAGMTPQDRRLLPFHSRHQMAHALEATEQWDEAEQEFRSILADLDDSEMRDSEYYPTVSRCLANSLRSQRRYADALETIDICLSWYDGRAPERSRTALSALRARHVRGDILRRHDRAVEAVYEMREVLTERLRTADPTDSVVLSERHCLAHALQEQRRYGEAQDELRGVAESYASIVGPNATPTRTVRWCLAVLAHDHGDKAEALDLYQKVLEAETAELGAEHTDTLVTHFRMAKCRYDMGSLSAAEAVDAYERIMEKQVALLGADNGRVVSIREAIAALSSRETVRDG